MVPPGFSVSEIAAFVNGTIRFIVSLVDAPTEIRAIENRATFGNSILASLQRKLALKLEEVDDEDLNILYSVKGEYESVVRDLNQLARKHVRCEEGGWGARFIWAVTEHFTEQCVKIKSRLEITQSQIETTLSLLNL
jgi:hypothetical protein